MRTVLGPTAPFDGPAIGYATICGMTRERISTTVDHDRLVACRRILGTNDSRLLDQALVVLLDQLEAEQERRALTDMPYDKDHDLAWDAPPAPSLPYDGDVPAEILRLAVRRRRRT
jgi:hypothetical protein